MVLYTNLYYGTVLYSNLGWYLSVLVDCWVLACWNVVYNNTICLNCRVTDYWSSTPLEFVYCTGVCVLYLSLGAVLEFVYCIRV